MNKDSFLDLNMIAAIPREESLILPWPTSGNPGGFLKFSTAVEWRDFISSLRLQSGVPDIIAAKFRRAQMLYFFSWIYFDLIKAGELAALTTLELALTDRYGNLAKKKGKYASFSDLLKYLLQDGLTDDTIPMIRRAGGSVVTLLAGQREPSLSQIRNRQAHGDPFDGLPWSGLLELVRDLIEYAYRDMIRGMASTVHIKEGK